MEHAQSVIDVLQSSAIILTAVALLLIQRQLDRR